MEIIILISKRKQKHTKIWFL